MNLASLEMLSTLESLADKLSSGHPKGILLDNNGNKLSCVIKQHPYQQNKPSVNGNSKFIEK